MSNQLESNQLDLNPRYLAMVNEILQRHVPSMSVWVYGSRVTGTALDASDIDLVIINSNEEPVPQGTLSALRAAFSDSYIPLCVDVFDWARIPEDFKSEILEAYIVLQEPNK